MPASIRADLFLATTCGLGVSGLIWTLALAPPSFGVAGLMALALAAVAGSVRVRIRGLGLLSPVYPAALATLVAFGPGSSCLAAIVCCAAGRLRRAHPPHPGRLLFRLSHLTLGCAAATLVYGWLGGASGSIDAGLSMLVAVLAHVLVFAVVRQGLVRLWMTLSGRSFRIGGALAAFFGQLPGLVAGSALAQGIAWAYLLPGPRLLLITTAVVGLALALLRERERRWQLIRHQRARISGMQRSVTGALARTMEAAGGGTRSHIQRVRKLCTDVGRRFKLGAAELETLAAAALLHDIGKVAVPDRILNKPGRLSPDEMEQIKQHPGLGAEILRGFPSTHPLAPIVRSHHERWDGRGYPDGLAGDAIPLGARILSVADCFDALTSDRPYRRALPPDEAVEFLRREAGRMFDPQVVQIFSTYLGECETTKTDPVAPPPSYGHEDPIDEPCSAGHLTLAQRELQTLYDISRAINYGLTFEEYLTLAACQLSSLVPYQALVVYVLDPRQRLLRASFAMGKAADKLRLMTIPLGERLSGWAAEHRRAAIGEDHLTPMDRDGSRSDLEEWANDQEVSTLCSTMVAPMIAGDGVVGVVTLYDHVDRQFTADERRVLVRVSGYIAEAAARHEERGGAGQTSLTDPLTGVPNARFLWLETAHRIAQGPAFGLLGFRINGLETVCERLGNETTDRILCQIARRFAASCEGSETLVRFGPELFLVLSPDTRSGELVDRWQQIAREVEQPALEIGDGEVHPLQLTAAHAAYPDDGETLDDLLVALDSRLSVAVRRGRTIVPFRSRRLAQA